jgi:hypothetical protein
MYFRSPSQSLAHDRNLTAYYKSLQEQQARGELADGFVLPTSPAAAEMVAGAASRYDMLATDLSETLLHEPYPPAAGSAAGQQQQQHPQQHQQRQRRRPSSSSRSAADQQQQHKQQENQQQRRRPGQHASTSSS